MNRVISPPLSEINKLRQPLTDGEKITLQYLDQNLPPAWEIYIQPHLNGLCPDIIILNPCVGIVVIEIKDWNLEAMSYQWEDASGKDSYKKLLATDTHGKTFRTRSPYEQLMHYKEEILELYMPRLGAQFKGHHKTRCISTALIMPFTPDYEALNFIKPALQSWKEWTQVTFFPVIGSDTLSAGNIQKLIHGIVNTSGSFMNESIAEDLRLWLYEPRFKADQRKPLPLDPTQKKLATTRTKSGFRRIRGAAGSGKTIVLAARAGNLMMEGKSVLVITYNITLCNYLRDIAARHASGIPAIQKKITFLNYHSWAKRICLETDNRERYKMLWLKKPLRLSEVLEYDMPALVSSIYRNDPDAPKYDAILVDEGQDCLQTWWSSLQSALKAGGEMLLVADKTQNLYERELGWTEKSMTGAGFRGDWLEMTRSYRLPDDMIPKIADFTERFIKPENRIVPIPAQRGLSLQPTSTRWVQVIKDEEAEIAQCVDEVHDFYLKHKNGNSRAFTDIVFISWKRKVGMAVVKRLGAKGIRVLHTFGHTNNADLPIDDEEEYMATRQQKCAFYMGRELVKATTIHSYKGMETSCLVLHIGSAKNESNMAAIYAALTRIKAPEDTQHDSKITVICSEPKLADYGQSWMTTPA